MHSNSQVKRVFISYSHADAGFASDLYAALDAKIGKEGVWIDKFDLTAGDELAPRISGAIQHAKWFIFLASKSSRESRWVRYEASLATFLAIERDDFKIITVKLDDSIFPEQLDIELRRRLYIDAAKNKSKAIAEIVNAISAESSTRSKSSSHVFFDRGPDSDKLQLAVEGSSIVFVVGMLGIGKTSLIEEAARSKLGRPYIKISIRPSHDKELIARQIISGLGLPQPDGKISDNSLIDAALTELKKTQEDKGTFLFLDDAEKAMDDGNRFRMFLAEFLARYMAKNFPFPIIVAASRKPEVPLPQIHGSQFIFLQGIPDDFIKQCIQYWSKFGKLNKNPIEMDSLDELVPHIGGHPLAARLLASYLIFETPLSIMKHFVSKFKLMVAEYVLSDILPMINEIDKLILEAIAVAETGLTTEDLMEIDLIKKGCNNDILIVQEAMSKLTRGLLISQEAEYNKLHPFMISYFERQAQEKKHFKEIASDLANQVYQKTISIENKLTTLNFQQGEDTNLNQRLLHYATSAHRLLMISGNIEKAKQIPFRLSGHIRELVFVFYQKFEDFNQSLQYANDWLKIDPNDTEIILYKARSLRRLGNYNGAEQVLSEFTYFSDRLTEAKIQRERGLIARDNNDLRSALKFFRAASTYKHNKNTGEEVPIYPLALVNLGTTLIAEADMKGGESLECQNAYREAVELFDISSRYLPSFDEINLAAYVDALLHLDRRDDAMKELERGLNKSPDDPLLNRKKAEILLKFPDRLGEAQLYAQKALNNGSQLARLTMAKILFLKKQYDEALKCIQQYSPQNPRDQLFADITQVEILMAKENHHEAKNILNSHTLGKNPYVDKLRIENEIKAAEKALYDQNYSDAEVMIQNAESMLREAKNKNSGFRTFKEIEEKITKVKNILLS